MNSSNTIIANHDYKHCLFPNLTYFKNEIVLLINEFDKHFSEEYYVWY